MNDWAVWRYVTAGDTLTDRVDFKMREADTGRDDHYSITDPESDPRFSFDWRTSTFVVENQAGHRLNGWFPVAIRNTDPVRIGLRDAPLDEARPFAGFSGRDDDWANTA